MLNNKRFYKMERRTVKSWNLKVLFVVKIMQFLV